MRTKQAGFTLIELIVVILIMGTLAAVALPRFMNAQTDARVAKAQALLGSVRAAAALAKSRCELDRARGLTAAGTCGNVTPQVTMDGQVVNMVNNYPAATANGILLAAQIVAANDNVTIVAGPPLQIQITGAPTLATCGITYNQAAVNAAPVITLAVNGC